MYQINDLHCDLLCYLAGDSRRTPYDPAVRCSIPQLKAGGVRLQVLPIFTETGAGSAEKGERQAECFSKLAKDHPDPFSASIRILAAVENASSFCEEDEPLDTGLKRLQAIRKKTGTIVYISLTWNTENRFGGGALTSVGLKDDGKKLLDFMQQKGIAVDLSHTSDFLAHDILNHIDRHELSLPVIASHSNFRSVTNVPRNLPDELAGEIIRRGGVIGMNFVRYFIGSESPAYFVRQLEHALSINAERSLCFGADFFYGDDVSPEYRKKPEEVFFPGYGDSGVYAKVMNLWKRDLGIGDDLLKGVAHVNLDSFLRKHHYIL